MTKRQFYLSVLIVAALGLVVGPSGYFMYQASLRNQQRQVEVERERHQKSVELERERTARSKNRWETADKMLQRVPFVRKDD